MFEALQITAEHLSPDNIHVVRRFLDPRGSAPISITGRQLAIRHKLQSFLVCEDEVIVKDRKTDEIQVLSAGEFERLYYDYNVAEHEIHRLGVSLQRKLPGLIGKRIPSLCGSADSLILETPVDVALHAIASTLRILEARSGSPEGKLYELGFILQGKEMPATVDTMLINPPSVCAAWSELDAPAVLCNGTIPAGEKTIGPFLQEALQAADWGAEIFASLAPCVLVVESFKEGDDEIQILFVVKGEERTVFPIEHTGRDRWRLDLVHLARPDWPALRDKILLAKFGPQPCRYPNGDTLP
jgi:hypothetical protein